MARSGFSQPSFAGNKNALEFRQDAEIIKNTAKPPIEVRDHRQARASLQPVETSSRILVEEPDPRACSKCIVKLVKPSFFVNVGRRGGCGCAKHIKGERPPPGTIVFLSRTQTREGAKDARLPDLAKGRLQSVPRRPQAVSSRDQGIMPANGTREADQRAGRVEENDVGFALDLPSAASILFHSQPCEEAGSHPAFFILGRTIYEFRTHSDA